MTPEQKKRLADLRGRAGIRTQESDPNVIRLDQGVESEPPPYEGPSGIPGNPNFDLSEFVRRQLSGRMARDANFQQSMEAIPAGEVFLGAMGKPPMDLAAGLGQIGAAGTDFFGITRGAHQKLTDSYLGHEQALGQAFSAHPVAANLGALTGGLATYGALPSAPANAAAARVLPAGAGQVGRAMAARGAEGAGIAAAQFNRPGESRLKKGLAGGAFSAGAVRLGNFSGQLQDKGGRVIMTAALKPSKQLRDSRGSNFDIANLVKRDFQSVFGPGKALEKIAAFQDDIESQMSQQIQQIPKVNIGGAISSARAKLEMELKQGANRDITKQIRDGLKYWDEQASEMTGRSGAARFVAGPKARDFRASLGRAAQYDRMNNTMTPGGALAAAVIRNELNAQIGRLRGGQQFRALDQEMAQTIPVRTAIEDAMGRQGNNYPMGMRESIAAAAAVAAGNPAAAVSLPAMIALSSRFGAGSGMFNAGRSLQQQSVLRDMLLRAGSQGVADRLGVNQ